MKEKDNIQNTPARLCSYIIYSTDAGNNVDVELFEDPNKASVFFDKEVEKEFALVRKENEDAFNFMETRDPYRATLSWEIPIRSAIRNRNTRGIRSLLHILLHRDRYCRHFCQYVLGDTTIE